MGVSVVIVARKLGSEALLEGLPSRPGATHRLLAGKERQKQLMVVHLNGVILGRLAVDLTFDLVTEDARFSWVLFVEEALAIGLLTRRC